MKPANPASPGRCLAVLLAALLLIGVWGRLPVAIFGGGTIILLLIGLNALVFQGATRPLWRGTRPCVSQDVYRGLVLVPCLLFHLLSPPFGLIWMIAQVMD
ncbi:hypothetical protein J7E24_05570 [Hymenobacter sp. ISL-91]|uniref:hypothetical protein n=1 Tax=Hymenobacter sp. ISL-91 TaxID=2819151 RepID=UPI001BEA8DC6|nr:hypothetical protein [Hymenobacter sp. ISL-91]MBT2557243.1 hypothetical protein [Hymenobacter sp. ISL-91]